VGNKYRCKGCDWFYMAQWEHGITREELLRILEEQNEICACCHAKCPDRTNLCVDHDHVTGKVRGLLCTRCNTALGLFKDDAERIRKAIWYLEEKKHRLPRRTRPRLTRGTPRNDKNRYSKFGVTPKVYARMLLEQKGICAICGAPPTETRSLAVDHAHTSKGHVRGLLDVNCNRALGLVKDSTRILELMARYVEGHN
jgi:hypothetical protein